MGRIQRGSGWPTTVLAVSVVTITAGISGCGLPGDSDNSAAPAAGGAVEHPKLPLMITFRSALDAASIQRVPDLMREFGVLTQPVDVASMLVKSAGS